MRYRQLDSNGDMDFGNGQKNFLRDTPETVAQAVQTSLLLIFGEWYLDINDGTPYFEAVLGRHTQAQADAALIARIKQVQGVVNILNFKSEVDPLTRKYSVVSGDLDTIYGKTKLKTANVGDF